MALAMLYGLTTGIYAGGLFHGLFFYSLAVALASGVILGVVLGWPLHRMAMVEGGFSGGMAGMMGAMTAEMLTIREVSIGLFFFMLLTIVCTLTTLQWVKAKNKKSTPFSFKCLIVTMSYVGIAFYFYTTAPPFIDMQTEIDEPSHDHHQHTQP